MAAGFRRARSIAAWGRLLVGFAGLASSGCAIGTAGAVARRLTVTETATVVEMFSFGSWLRTAAFDRGFSLGYRSTSYVYPNASPQKPSQEWDFFWFRLPDREAFCIADTLVGAGIEATDGPAFSLGYLSQTARIGPGFGESVAVRFRFDRSDPAKTVLEVSRSQ